MLYSLVNDFNQQLDYLKPFLSGEYLVNFERITRMINERPKDRLILILNSLLELRSNFGEEDYIKFLMPLYNKRDST